MKRVGTYIRDHFRGRHHLMQSIASACIAYAAAMGILLGVSHVFLQPMDLKTFLTMDRPRSPIGDWLILGSAILARVVQIWGIVGAVWSALRTLGHKNPSVSWSRFLALTALALFGVASLIAVFAGIDSFLRYLGGTT